MPQKRFKLAAHELRSVAVGYGSCYATDRITVDGAPVGYCYREDPSSDHDSGWRFLAGDESDAYANNPDNLAIYDVNTIANYDHAITLVLDAPPGTAFERSESGALVAVED